MLSIDTESNGKDIRKNANPDGKTIGISLGHRPAIFNGEVLLSDYYAFHHKYNNLDPEVFGMMKRLIETYEGTIVMHNAKHDIAALANMGIEVPRKKLFCTMLGVTWVNEELKSKSLDYASRHYGGQPKNRSKEMQNIIDAWGWGYVPPEMMYEYAANDAKITLELFEAIWPSFYGEGFSGPLWERELRFIDLIMRMESRGILTNEDFCTQKIEQGTGVMTEIRDRIKRNPSSGKDLKVMLIDEMGLPVLEYTDNGAPSFKAKVMEEYEQILENRGSHLAKDILTYRGWQKAIGASYKNYIELRSPDGVLRCNYKLHGTRQVRMSCELPNLQQIPRESVKVWNGDMKKSFVARPGFTLWEADYGQLELRIAAVYSQDPTLIEVFTRGVSFFKDMHGRMPQWEYNDLKTNTYATLYGAGLKKIALILNRTPAVAQEMRNDFYGAYPGLRTASQRASSIASRRGYLKMWTGRRRHFGADVSTHKGFNSLCQGGGAEIVKSAMLDLDEVIDWVECSMLLQIHDSVVFEIANGTEDKWIPKIREVMETPHRYNEAFGQIPFPVDIYVFGEK